MDDSDEGDDDADWVEVDEVGEEALDCKETYEERCHPDKVKGAKRKAARAVNHTIVFSRSLATAPSPASSSPPSTAPRSTRTRTCRTPGAGRSAGPCVGRRHGNFSKTHPIPTYLLY